MDALALEHHLTSPQGAGHVPAGGFTVLANGGSCCDKVAITISTDGERVTDAGFSADGCGSAHAAGSAAVTLVRGRGLLEAARIGAGEIAAELGGLSPAKRHAADVAAEALARSLGAAVRASGALPAPGHGAGRARAGRAGRLWGPEGSHGQVRPPERTLVAMSGGVDSAVAALLCVAAGAETVAVTLELWADPENDAERSCCSASAVAQARAMAHRLGLPHFTIDLRDEFRAGVVEPFIAGYDAGETPNPCVGCNGHVRLDAMLELAERLGAAQLATGHYARVVHENGDRGLPLLRAAADPAKDQTYMLAALAPDSLARMSFPLGELTKPEVRGIAARAGLPVASKADSQDLCFLAGTDRARFLARHGGVADRAGEIVDVDGEVLALHRGHHRFTVGQRRGLGVASGEPLFVLSKDARANRVVVGPERALQIDRVCVRAARLHRPGARVDRVKLRYRSKPIPAAVVGSPAPGAGRHRQLTLALGESVNGAAPGQLACLMDGELIVGWGTIAAG
ncbi:MAG: tRNA 2-thiouridine(34) synthase MnmA [Solirubrobacteraceae bacterium]